MNANNARALLALIGQYTINDVVNAGALDAISELIAASKSASDTKGGIYLTVPYTNEDGLRKIDAIKTIRVMYNIGLTEAKDMFEMAMLTSKRFGDGSVCIGPFSTKNVSYQTAADRVASASACANNVLLYPTYADATA